MLLQSTELLYEINEMLESYYGKEFTAAIKLTQRKACIFKNERDDHLSLKGVLNSVEGYYNC